MTKIIRYESIYNPNDKEFIGIIYSIKKTDYGYSLTLKAKEKLIVYLKDNDLPSRGDSVTVNYIEYLYHNKIFYILNAKEIKVLKENENIIYKLKNNLLKYLDTFKSNNYLKSFILADTSYLDNEIYNSYQINGICHLLSIGSTHITFLSIFLLYIFKKLKFKEVISYLFIYF